MSLPWDSDDRVPRAADAIVPRPLELRASDAEREQVAQALREHAQEGRLDDDELEERLGLAYGAPRRSDLAELLGDLPAGMPAPRPVARVSAEPEPLRQMGQELERARGGGWVAFGTVTSVLVVIWAISGFGYFWPAWVMVWWALFLVFGHNRRRRRRR